MPKTLNLIVVLILTASNILLTVHFLQNYDCKPNEFERINGVGKKPGVSSPVPTCTTEVKTKEDVKDWRSGSSVSDELQDLVGSFNLKLGRWDNSKMYKLFDHVIRGDQYIGLSKKFNVCLASQSSIEKLFSIVEVAIHWTGPISVAVFAAGDDELNMSLLYILFLRSCFWQIRERVNFHFAYPRIYPPSRIQLNTKLLEHFNCNKYEETLKRILKMTSGRTSRWRVKNEYPQNHLRNLARKNCLNEYIFLTDIDIVPSFALAEGLNEFLSTNFCSANKLCAYVIPTFEIDERVRFPPNKSDLVRLAHKGLARPFHHKVFIYNQFATNFTRWQKELDTSSAKIHISHPVTNFEFLYEPFYVAADTVPEHDERFIGYGYTRNTQVYEMFVAGYEFFVLSPAFTCHWGLQKKWTRPVWREKQNIQNRKRFEVFKREVFARYQNDPLKMMDKRKETKKS